MRFIILLFALISALAFGGCAHPDYASYPVVASVDPQMAPHVEQMLKRAGIQAFTHGSVVYGVSVAPKHRTRAVELLRQDAAAHGYQIWF